MSDLSYTKNASFRTTHFYLFISILFLISLNTNAQVAINAGDYYPNSTVQAIAEDDSYIYIGGQFTELSDGTNTSNLSYLVRYDKNDYSLDESWDLQLDNKVVALIIDGDYLYIGGNFTTVLGTSRQYAAKINIAGTDPTVDASWDPSPSNPVWSMSMGDNAIFIGGSFSTIGNTSVVTRNTIAKLDKTNGDADADFNPNLRNYISYGTPTYNPGIVYDIIYDEVIDSVYVAGSFTDVGNVQIKNLTKLGSDGNPDTDWQPTPNSTVNDIALLGDDLFLSGRFTQVNSQSLKFIAKTSTKGDGSPDLTWDPSPSPTRTGYVNTMQIIGSDLYAGGSFSSIGGESIVRLAKLSTTGAGAADATWAVDNGGSFNCMLLSGDHLFVGGNFTSLDGQSSIQRFGVVYVKPQEIDLLGNGNSITNGDDSPNEGDGTDFGAVTIGSLLTHTFTIANEGSRPLDITDIQISGTDAPDFSVSNITLPASVSALANTTFDITYDPSSLGTSSATLQISSSDEDEGAYAFIITGTAQTPAEINVQGESVDIVSGDETPSLDDGTDFGTATVGSTVTNTFTIQNTGEATLNISSVTISGTGSSDFSISNITTPASINGAESTTFDVTYDPSSSGTNSATVEILSDDSDEGTYTYTVTGIAQTPAEINVQGQSVDIVSGDETPSLDDGTDFGTATVGSTVTNTFTIQNTGEATLNISSVTISGTGSSDFSISNITTPASINGAESTTFDVTYDPSSSGTSSATVEILNNDADEGVYSFSVVGIGEEPLGFDDLPKMNEIRVFPNPSKDFFKLEVKDKTSFEQLILINSQGKEVVRFVPSSTNEYDISLLSNGMYIMVVEKEGIRYKAGRLIKK